MRNLRPLFEVHLAIVDAMAVLKLFCVSLPISRIKVRVGEVQIYVCRPSGTASWAAKYLRRLYVRTAAIPYFAQSGIPARCPSTRTPTAAFARSIAPPAGFEESRDVAPGCVSSIPGVVS